MGQEYIINGRKVTAQEFEEFREIIAETNPRVEHILDDNNVTSEEIKDFLDFRADGSINLEDFQYFRHRFGPVNSCWPPFPFSLFSDNVAPQFQKMNSMLRKHGFKIEDHITHLEDTIGLYPDFVRQDRDIMLAAIRKNAYNIIAAGDNLKRDPKFMLAAMKCYHTIHPLNYMDPTLSKNRQFMLEAIKHDAISLDMADPSLRNNVLFLVQAGRTNFNVFERIHPEDLRQKVWDITIVTLHLNGIYFPETMEKNIAAFYKGLKEMGITDFPQRFRSFETIHTIIQNRAAPLQSDGSQPLALAIFNRDDWNDGFAKYPLVDQFVEGGLFHFLYYEVSNEKEVYAILKVISQAGERPIHTLVLAGHGSPNALALKEADRGDLEELPPPEIEDKYIDVGDLKNGEWKELGQYLQPNGQVVLYACFNGQGGKDGDNLANAFANNLPPGITIYSSQDSGNIYNLEINPDLTLNIEWRKGDTYTPVTPPSKD